MWLINFYAFSHQAKSIRDAVQEVEDGNTEAYMGLTDSIVEIIKFFPPCQPGSQEETAINKVIRLQ